jgi:uncharacterized protein with HEPN domain
LAQAFTDGYIADNTAWRSMKKLRELSSHTYDQETADEITKSIIAVYWRLLKDLEERLEQERSSEQTTNPFD